MNRIAKLEVASGGGRGVQGRRRCRATGEPSMLALISRGLVVELLERVLQLGQELASLFPHDPPRRCLAVI